MNQAIKKAAQFRNAVANILTKEHEPIVISELLSKPDIAAIDITNDHARQIISDMTRKGPLKRIRVHRRETPQARFAYEIVRPANKPQEQKNEIEIPKPAHPTKQPLKPKMTINPDGIELNTAEGTNIIYNEKTGKLELNLHGLKIEMTIL